MCYGDCAVIHIQILLTMARFGWGKLASGGESRRSSTAWECRTAEGALHVSQVGNSFLGTGAMMSKGRLEAFSDGVLAIIITIMVLEMKTPKGAAPSDLVPLLSTLLTYVLSFIYLGIYWSNHHHMFHLVHRVNGAVLWANLHLLFWLSLIPLVTRWMDDSRFATWPVAAYGFVLLMAAIAWEISRRTLVGLHGPDSEIAQATAHGYKELSSVLLYGLALLVSFVYPPFACAIYALVAAMWIVPDRRVERTLTRRQSPGKEKE